MASAGGETPSTASHASSSHLHGPGGGGGSGAAASNPGSSSTSNMTSSFSGAGASGSASASGSGTGSGSALGGAAGTASAATSVVGAGSSVPSSTSYQPLSLADALARASAGAGAGSADSSAAAAAATAAAAPESASAPSATVSAAALDEVLAERNRFCLEAGKLSNENMRIWSLMGRIRKENEALKARVAELEKALPPNAPAAAASAAAAPRSAGAVPAGSSSSSSSATPALSSSAAPASAPPTPLHAATRSDASAATAIMQQRAAAAAQQHASAGAGAGDMSASSALGAGAGAGGAAAGAGVQGRASLDSQGFDVEAVEASDAEASDDLERSVSQPAPHQQQQPQQQQQQLPQQQQVYYQQPQQQQLAQPYQQQSQQQDAHTYRAQQQQQQLQQAQQQYQQQAQVPAHLTSPGRPRGDAYSGALGGMAAGAGAGAGAAAGAAAVAAQNSRALELSELLASAAVESSSTMPRVDSGALHALHVGVERSTIRATIGKERDVASFTIRIENPAIPEPPPAGAAAVAGPPRVWRVEKTYAEIAALDARLRQKWGKSGAKKLANVIPPDKSLFKDHAPSKVDQRKAMLERWLHDCIAAPLPDKDDIATFLCTDIVAARGAGGAAGSGGGGGAGTSREGYLTKKGQNLGRWVTRYYVLRPSRLDFYEARNGQQIGSIDIRGAQIGRQQKSATSDMDDNSYRHAFLVLERRNAGADAAPAAGAAPGAAAGSAQLVRHVLCAESDADRDEWVDALVRAIAELEQPARPPTSQQQQQPDAHGGPGSSMPASPTYAQGGASSSAVPLGLASAAAGSSMLPPASPARPTRTGSLSRRFRGGGGGGGGDGSSTGHGASSTGHHHGLSSPTIGSSVLASDAGTNAGGHGASSSVSAIGAGAGRSSYPTRTMSPDYASSAANGARTSNDMPSTPQRGSVKLPISGPMNGAPIPLGYKFGAKDELNGGSADGHGGAGAGGAGAGGKKDDKKRFWQGLRPFGGDKAAKPEHRPIFGVPLAEAVGASSIGERTGLPAVVYRCIEYLEKRNAAAEEGIYRLSGSSAVIKSLKDRFNAEGDVDLTAADQFYDPHAIAGLLKTYLRELPTSVLTRELHMEFMRVNEIPDRVDRINELGQLVCMLPMPNYALLRTLCGHLIKIIQHSDVNKMTMRNVGIVFSPTLAIPAGVFALFLTEFDWVFYTDAHGEPAPRQMPPVAEETSAEQQGSAAGGAVGLALPSPRTGTRNANRGSFVSGGMIRTGDGTPLSSVGRSNRNSLQYNDSDLERYLGLARSAGSPITAEDDMVAAVNGMGGVQYSGASPDDAEDFRRDADAALIYGEQNASPLQEIRAA